MPPRATILNGNPDSPVLLHVARRAQLALPDSIAPSIPLESLDAATESVAKCARTHAAVRPHLIVNDLSPLPEAARLPGDADPIDHIQPYAWLVTDLIEERLTATGRAVIVDISSYPNESTPVDDQPQPHPEVCRGIDFSHTPAALLDAAVIAFGELVSAGPDIPQPRRYVPQTQYGNDQRVQAITVAIRNDVLLDGHFAVNPESVERLGRAIGEVIGARVSPPAVHQDDSSPDLSIERTNVRPQSYS
ncbi:N-formylglutamate amidohydrolase [Gordonia sp. PS3]|uniref:N-formylglutamate amidohydrolase n=1 Tax=Gordonia sp. PS3 TaxID=3248841 RepID=UPI0035C00CCD